MTFHLTHMAMYRDGTWQLADHAGRWDLVITHMTILSDQGTFLKRARSSSREPIHAAHFCNPHKPFAALKNCLST